MIKDAAPPVTWVLVVMLRNGYAFTIECDEKPHGMDQGLTVQCEFQRVKGRNNDSFFRTEEIVAWRIIEQHTAVGRIVDDPRKDAN